MGHSQTFMSGDRISTCVLWMQQVHSASDMPGLESEHPPGNDTFKPQFPCLYKVRDISKLLSRGFVMVRGGDACSLLNYVPIL